MKYDLDSNQFDSKKYMYINTGSIHFVKQADVGHVWECCNSHFDYDITVTSHGSHGVTNHWQVNCLFKSLFRIPAKEIPKLHFAGFCEGRECKGGLQTPDYMAGYWF